MQTENLLARCLCILSMFAVVAARIHKLEVHKDTRRFIALSTFGFYKGGSLTVNLTHFKAEPFTEDAVFGFTLDRTLSDAMHPYLNSHQDKCLLQEFSNPKSELDQRDDNAIIYFTMDFKNLMLKVNCKRNVRTVHIYKDTSMLAYRAKRASFPAGFSDTALFPRRKRNISHEMERSVIDHQTNSKSEAGPCSNIELRMTTDNPKNPNYYNASFVVYIASEEEEGLYNLYFHNCPNYKDGTPVGLDFEIEIAEMNTGNFLSAGEMPLPALYFMMALLFMLSGCFWVFILKKSTHPVFKIHYLMTALVYLKSLSMLFHGINYHFIQTRGEHVAAWAVLYYITHLLKGALLYITIILVGTGWTFIKNILANKDKKIFMIVIPLQVLANIAEVIIEESEEGNVEHKTWRDVFMLADLLCCGAILFPVVWSIRHLREAARTDGTAAANLRMLMLFRHFYSMIVAYIYFTRVIVYLLKIGVPFQYEWLDEMFREMATYVFFVLTGYKFRPASAHTYFSVATNDTGCDDDEMDVVISGGSGVTKRLSKVNKVSKVAKYSSDMSSTLEERDNAFKRETAQEYD